MNIVSLYKIWRGKEFLVESLESNYCHVEGMVFVSSETSWTGERGNNTRDVVQEWKKKNDRFDKIRIVDFDTVDQGAQYQKGVEYIRDKFPECTWMQIVDSDEVWDEVAWNKAIEALYQYGPYPRALGCMMRSFIKSRDFVIDEGPKCVRPVVFVRSYVNYNGCRFNKTPGTKLMPDVRVDHYGLVRDSWEDVLKKITTSQKGDKQDYLVDMEKWKSEVWDKIPDGRCSHYYKGLENIWRSFYRRDN